MSDSAATPSKPGPRDDTCDRQALAHVEKWMAVIREINGERRTDAKLPS